MKSFCQRDPIWTNIVMLPSSLTLGRFGCTTTCIADLSTYFGDNLNPHAVCNRIKYTPGGLIIWQSAVFEHFEFERREYGRKDANIEAALKDPNRAVILNVGNGSHWVVAVSRDWFGNYKIADPWMGDFLMLEKRYGRSIQGAAYFRRKK